MLCCPTSRSPQGDSVRSEVICGNAPNWVSRRNDSASAAAQVASGLLLAPVGFQAGHTEVGPETVGGQFRIKTGFVQVPEKGPIAI